MFIDNETYFVINILCRMFIVYVRNKFALIETFSIHCLINGDVTLD